MTASVAASCWLAAFAFAAQTSIAVQPPTPQKEVPPRLILAHYMPWFEAKLFRTNWGWHWTMGHSDPEHIVNGRREAASHAYPLIGLYDSGDLDALECQVLLMKLAGIDGVIVDWYGTDEYLDYGSVNRNVLQLIPVLQRAGMRFAICYEDQTVPREIAAGRIPATEAVAHGQRLMTWMQGHFFSSPQYLRIDGRPLLLSFGAPYYSDTDWNAVFSVLPVKPQFVTENDRREPTASVGGFDWPSPGGSTTHAAEAQSAFYERARLWPLSIAAAFPRFDDFYAQAGVGKSYGQIADQDGRTYEETLSRALRSSASFVQLVTWNDWGEGTQIEPSIEFGYRDLETTQRLRRQFLGAGLSADPRYLRLPVTWYLLQKKHGREKDLSAREGLARFFPLVAAGHLDQAQALLARYK